MPSNTPREMVQNDATRPRSKRRTSAQPRSRRETKASGEGRGSSVLDSPYDNPSDLQALRKARLDYINTPTDERRERMKYVGETVIREPVRKADDRDVNRVSGSKRRRRVTDPESKHRHRKVRFPHSDAAGYQSVYGERRVEKDDDHSEVEPGGEETDDIDQRSASTRTSSEETPLPRIRRSEKVKTPIPREPHVTHKGKTHTSQRRCSEPIERLQRARRKSYANDERRSASIPRKVSSAQRSHASRPPLSRPPLSRPPLSRTTTATTARSSSLASLNVKATPRRSTTLPPITESKPKKSPSIISSLLRTPSAPQINIKKVSCLTCGSDDVLIFKTAKLACTHRMCHDCLRRIFTMSITDPAHMPPKCCTSDHIPLKHVDKLFDQKFKKIWNRKFQEYSTQNRIYCPARRCGEWIKPNHIVLEGGRKVGKCKKCGTRVCRTCSSVMHSSRDCPKDPATKMFVEAAKEAGWKRCYNCSAMVELKEGCNHMTCRCTAEFCMVCGNKWKTCDCPWFNFEAVEADRLEHLLMDQGRRGLNGDARRRRNDEGAGRNHDGDARRAPIRYQEEWDRRREQEGRDEALARWMQGLGVDDEGPANETGRRNEDAGHNTGGGIWNPDHLNADVREYARQILMSNFRQAAQAADGLLNAGVHDRAGPLAPAGIPGLPELRSNAANRSPQAVGQDATLNHAASDNAARTGANERTIQGGRLENAAVEHAPDDFAEPEIPLPPPLTDAARRPPPPRNGRHVHRSNNADIWRAGGRWQTGLERSAEERIDSWMNDVPVGDAGPGEGLT